MSARRTPFGRVDEPSTPHPGFLVNLETPQGARTSTLPTAKRARYGEPSSRPPLGELGSASRLSEGPLGQDDLVKYMVERGGKIQDLEQQLEQLKQENQHKASLIAKQTNSIAGLEAELSTYKSLMETERRKEVLEAQQLDHLLQQALTKNKVLQQEVDKLRMDLAARKAKVQELSGTILKEQDDQITRDYALEQQLTQARQKHVSELTACQTKVTQLEIRLKSTSNKAGLLEEQVSSQQSTIQAQQRTIDQLRRERDQLEVEVANRRAEAARTSASSTLEELQFEVRSLREELTRKTAELAQAGDLKKHRQHLQSLEDQLATAESKVHQAEEVFSEKEELKSRVEELEREGEQWRSLFRAAGVEEPGPGAILEMQKQMMDLQQQVLERGGEVRLLQSQLTQAGQRLAESQQVQTTLKGELDQVRKQLEVSEKKLAIANKECHSLHRLFASVDHETRDLAQEVETSPEAGRQAAQRLREQGERIRELEEQKEDLRRKLTQQQEEVLSITAELGHHKLRGDQAERKVQQLEKEADKLGREVGELQSRLNRGEFNRSTTRVLHLKMNPETMAHKVTRDARLEQLEAENKALKGVVDKLESQMKEGSTASTKALGGHGVDLAVKDAEIAVAKRKVEQLDKQLIRLKEVFKDRITVFREACFHLFGYRVDMISDVASRRNPDAPTTFIIKPHHCNEFDAQLVFRYTPRTGMELMPTRFSEHLKTEVQTYIVRFRSIPAFTANLTMEYFQKATPS